MQMTEKATDKLHLKPAIRRTNEKLTSVQVYPIKSLYPLKLLATDKHHLEPAIDN